ncbi:hypothetical protein KIPB_016543, partial [Kipferlia bialata]
YQLYLEEMGMKWYTIVLLVMLAIGVGLGSVYGVKRYQAKKAARAKAAAHAVAQAQADAHMREQAAARLALREKEAMEQAEAADRAVYAAPSLAPMPGAGGSETVSDLAGVM